MESPLKPGSVGILLKISGFFFFFFFFGSVFVSFFKHAVNFCEVTYTYGYHFICYDDAKYIDI